MYTDGRRHMFGGCEKWKHFVSVQLFFSCAAAVRSAADEWRATPSGESWYYQLGLELNVKPV